MSSTFGSSFTKLLVNVKFQECCNVEERNSIEEENNGWQGEKREVILPIIPAGPDPTTTTSQDFSHHAIWDDEEADADSDAVSEDVAMAEGRIFCALAERIKIIKKKRCMKIDEEEVIEEVDISVFQSRELRIKSQTDQQCRCSDAKRNKIWVIIG
jgi:hypothetical protein